MGQATLKAASVLLDSPSRICLSFADVRAFDAVYDHILKMSDALADGIVKQFPDKFPA